MQRVPFQTLLEGFAEARDRFHAVMGEEDRGVTFKPVFEALAWASALDNGFEAAWRKSLPKPPVDGLWSDRFSYGETVKGVRFVRNRVHHVWADALHLSRSGNRPEKEADPDWLTWRWRLARSLPGGKRRGKEPFETEYVQHVEANRVVHTLRELSTCFQEAAPELHPD